MKKKQLNVVKEKIGFAAFLIVFFFLPAIIAFFVGLHIDNNDLEQSNMINYALNCNMSSFD